MALGRKSFVPSVPVYVPDDLIEADLTALRKWPWLLGEGKEQPESWRMVLEDKSEGSVRLDQPVAPFSARRFGPRFVKSLIVSAGDEHVPDPALA